MKEPQVIIESHSPYICRACCRSFPDRSSFGHHKATHHIQQTNIADPLTCSTCPSSFTTRQCLEHHQERMHNQYAHSTLPADRLAIDYTDRYCSVCRSLFGSIESYSQHLVQVHRVQLKPVVQIYPSDFTSFKKPPKLNHRKPKKVPDFAIYQNTDKTITFCSICERQYRSRITYRVHVKQFHKPVPPPLPPVTAPSALVKEKRLNRPATVRHVGFVGLPDESDTDDELANVSKKGSMEEEDMSDKPIPSMDDSGIDLSLPYPTTDSTDFMDFETNMLEDSGEIDPFSEEGFDQFMMSELKYSEQDEEALIEESIQHQEQKEDNFLDQMARAEKFQRAIRSEVVPDLDSDNTCTVCNFQFSQQLNFRRHLVAVHGIDPVTGHSTPKPIVPEVREKPVVKPISKAILKAISKAIPKAIPKPRESTSRPKATQNSTSTRRFAHKMRDSKEMPDINNPDNHCTVCNHTYYCKSNFKIHLRNIHNIPLPCRVYKKSL